MRYKGGSLTGYADYAQSSRRSLREEDGIAIGSKAPLLTDARRSASGGSMGAPRPRPQIARAMQRQLHCDLGGVSTCANDVLHSASPTVKERSHDASAEDFARLCAQVREPKPPLEPGVGAGLEVAIRQALKLRPSNLLAQAIRLRHRARMGVLKTCGRQISPPIARSN